MLASDGLGLENCTREQVRLHRALELLLWPRAWPGTAAENAGTTLRKVVQNDVQTAIRKDGKEKDDQKKALPESPRSGPESVPRFFTECARPLAAQLLAAERRVLQGTRVQAALLRRARQFQAHSEECGRCSKRALRSLVRVECAILTRNERDGPAENAEGQPVIMSSLNASLAVALSGLAAEQGALAATADNVANVNTPGYSREVPVLTTNDPDVVGPLTFGTGVDLQSIESIRDPILESQIQQEETQTQGQLNSLVSALQQAQVNFNPSSGDIGTAISNFFDSINQLSGNPADLSHPAGSDLRRQTTWPPPSTPPPTT